MIYQIESWEDLIKAAAEAKNLDTIVQTSTFIRPNGTIVRVANNVDFADLDIDNEVHLPYKAGKDIAQLQLRGSASLYRCKVSGTLNEDIEKLQAGILFDQGSTVRMYECGSQGINYIAFWFYRNSIVDVYSGEFRNSAVQLDVPFYGHPLWYTGGKLLPENPVPEISIHTSIFDDNRHHIASNYHIKNLNLYYCTFMFGKNNKHGVDSHSENGIGGGNTNIIGCTFLNYENYAFDLPTPYNGYKVKIVGNFFSRAKGRNGRIGKIAEDKVTDHIIEQNEYPDAA